MGRKIISRNVKVVRANLEQGTSPIRSIDIIAEDARSHKISHSKNLIPESNLVCPDWFLSKEIVDVSVIVPMFRSKLVIEQQIESWDLVNDGLSKEIIYVDDACPEQSNQQVIKSWKNKTNKPIGSIFLNKFNSGYANACNIGAKNAKGEFLIFLNADCTVTPNWIKPLVDLAISDKKIGIIGNLQMKQSSIFIDSAGSEWSHRSQSFEHIGKHIYNGIRLSQPFTIENSPKDMLRISEREMVTGCCFLIRKSLFEEIGGFDQEYRIGYWEDADLNMKVQSLGYKIYFTPESIIHHRGGHSRAGGHKYINANRNRFHKKWVENRMIKAFINPNASGLNGTNVKNESVVVYTAIAGDYDMLKDQPKKDVDFFAFLEHETNSKTWKFKQVHNEFEDPNRNAKIHKVMPHIFFPDKQYSLWIDGSVKILFPFELDKLIQMYLSDADMALFKHPDRNCIYQEADVCIKRNLDDPDIIKKQIERYSKSKYLGNLGLVEATVILRRHTSEIKIFNEAWWEEIRNGSRRDQISFNYVANKLGIKFNYFPENLRKNNHLFKRYNHKHQ